MKNTSEPMSSVQAGLALNQTLAHANRWFVRCAGCLSVMAIETEGYPRGLTCGACCGKVEVMGRVERARLVTGVEHKSVCDARCTNARGPICDCPCAGANHGSKMVVVVTVTAGIPSVTPVSVGEAFRIFSEYKTAYDAATLLLDPATSTYPGAVEFRKKQSGQYLTADEFGRYLTYTRAMRALLDTKKRRTHKSRMDDLKKLTEGRG